MKTQENLVIAFGSRARGTAGASSDFDVAVLFDHELSLAERSKLVQSLARKLGVSEEQVDLVDLRTASPLLQYRVTNEGRLLEGDQFDFLRFRVLAWKRYLDTAKFRRARERALAEKYGQ